VPRHQTFELLRGPQAEHAGFATSGELRTGLAVELAEKDTAEVLMIRRVKR
jgi:hypothetical protein